MAAVQSRIAAKTGIIHVVDTGGPGLPLVLLHGSGASSQAFYKQWAGPLARDRRMIAIDLPGHGASDNAADPQAAYTVDGLADAVQQVLGKLSVSRAAFLGWSLGGHVVVELLARKRLVAGAMLCGTPPLSPGLVGSLRAFLPSLDILLASKEVYSEKDVDRFAVLCFGDQGHPSFRTSIGRTDGKVRSVFVKNLTKSKDQRATVLAADVPVAFVNGQNDPFIRQSYVAGLKVALPMAGGAQIIEGAGHAPFWTHASAFNALLGQFLAQVDAHERAGEREIRAAS